MISINPYLFFNGTCRAALTRYGEIFGATPELMSAEGMPPDFPVDDDKRDWIMHGTVQVGDQTLMASDNLFGEPTEMSGAAVQVSIATTAAAAALFTDLAEGGEITMPFGPTFWSSGFGTCTDQFGVRWMVSSEETV